MSRASSLFPPPRIPDDACYNLIAMASLPQSLQSSSVDVQGAVEGNAKGFPFRTELSLAPLLSFWSSEFGNVLSPKGRFAGIVQEEAEKAPELFGPITEDRKSTRLNSSHRTISYAVFCLKKKKSDTDRVRTQL